MCEDFPCCGHTPTDPCDGTYIPSAEDEPFDPLDSLDYMQDDDEDCETIDGKCGGGDADMQSDGTWRCPWCDRVPTGQDDEEEPAPMPTCDGTCEFECQPVEPAECYHGGEGMTFDEATARGCFIGTCNH